MDMSLEQIMEFARQQWGDGLELSGANVHSAAVGLASTWYRNTDAVETLAHAEGPWADTDMLRQNAWATELARLAINDVIAAGDSLEDVEDVFKGLLEELAAMLPTPASRAELQSEKSGAPGLATDWIAANGLGNWLALLVNGFAYPSAWWGAPGYTAIVDRYCELDQRPPEPETFRARMLAAPWDLSEEQAEFVCRHRYDVR